MIDDPDDHARFTTSWNRIIEASPLATSFPKFPATAIRHEIPRGALRTGRSAASPLEPELLQVDRATKSLSWTAEFLVRVPLSPLAEPAARTDRDLRLVS